MVLVTGSMQIDRRGPSRCMRDDEEGGRREKLKVKGTIKGEGNREIRGKERMRGEGMRWTREGGWDVKWTRGRENEE